MYNICEILWLIFFCLNITEQFHPDLSPTDPIDTYCSSFSSCRDCKKAHPQCDWCHEVGCTHFPKFHCSQKVLLDRTYKMGNEERFCTEIIADNAIFVAANLKRFIKMKLKIDDLTIYKRNVLCEIHIEEKILRVRATINENILYCDMVILEVTRSAGLGYIRLLWGGAEPYSNMILIIVYRCEFMASNCVDCQVLDRGFNCGWCQETSSCSLLEECPRRSGSWINRKSLCDKEQNFYSSANIKPFLEYKS